MQAELLKIALLALLLNACQTDFVFSRYKTLPEQWHKDSIVEFNFSPKDTAVAHNIFINIRNSNDYPFSNLFLITELEYPNGKTLKDTLEYVMAKPSGELLGKGFSDIKENKLWYKEQFVFNEIGTYHFKIQQAMRKSGEEKGVETLEGVLNVGLSIEYFNKNTNNE